MKADQHAIRELAYRLWEQRGRWDGSADEDWLAAERQLSEQAAQGSSTADGEIQLFPEDESIASAVPNKPPANVQVQLNEVNAAYSRKSRSAKSAAAADSPAAASRKKPRAVKDSRA